MTSLGSRIGSPAMKGERAIEPVESAWWRPDARSRRMKLLLAVRRRPGLPLHVVRGDRLAERDVGLRDQDVDGRRAGDRAERARLLVGSAREIGGNAAGADSDGQDDNACGIHTLHFPHYAAALAPP